MGPRLPIHATTPHHILRGKLPLTDPVYAFWKGDSGLRPWARSGAQNVQAAEVSRWGPGAYLRMLWDREA